MLAVLSITAPIFILIAIGFAAVRSGLMPQEAIPGLGRFVIYFTLPALMFSTISRMKLDQVIEPNYLSVYALGSLATLTLSILFNYRVLGNTLTEASVKGAGMTVPNSAFIGFPVLLQTFSSPPTQAFAMAVMVENILILPLALILMELGNGRDNGAGHGEIWRTVLMRIVRNPLIIAIVAGVSASALSLSLPAVINRSLDLLSHASAATALFVIGGSLVGNQVRGNLTNISTVTIGKLLLHPLMVALVLWLWPGFDPTLQTAVLIVAAMPMFSIFPIIGGNYGMRTQCASILLVTTATSFITITLLLRFVI